MHAAAHAVRGPPEQHTRRLILISTAPVAGTPRGPPPLPAPLRSDNYYHLSQRHDEVPRLTPDHLEAIRLFNELASSPELRLDWILQPGDVQLLSNHTCLHFRGAFKDSPAATRHLLRLWVSPPNDRPLPACYSEIMGGSVAPGKRGGIFIPGAEANIPEEAE